MKVGIIRVITMLLSAVTLNGCATTEGYRKAMESEIGTDEAELVRKWGTPEKISENNGRKLLVYVRSRNIYVPSSGPVYQYNTLTNTASPIPFSNIPAQNIPVRCETRFEVVNKKVVSYSFEGNGCEK